MGQLLTQIEDSRVVTLILRAIWLLDRQRTYPRYIRLHDLRRDRVLCLIIDSPEALDTVLEEVLALSVFLKVRTSDNDLLFLNTDSTVRYISNMAVGAGDDPNAFSEDGGWETPAASAPSAADAFRAYEENIGVLSPMIRESITSALQDFTDEQISEAIKISVENESRSWSFVAGVLRRWARDGVPHARRSEQSRQPDERRRISEAELRRYLDQKREGV